MEPLSYCLYLRGKDLTSGEQRWLPEDAIVERASGLIPCPICHRRLYDHPQYRYPTDTNGAYRDCTGAYLHL